MRVLVVNNTIFYEENESLYLNKETGLFFVKLKELGLDISTFQISQTRTEADSFANYAISDKGLKIYNVSRKKNRFVAFLKSFFVIQKAIKKNDFVYIFYPGPICMVIGLMCFLYRKPYGLYIRGEQGINSRLSKFLLKKASMVLTISPKFTDNVLIYNDMADTIRPMIGFSESDIVYKRSFGKNDVIRLLFVGRVVLDKGVFELVEAVNILVQKGCNVNLKIVGNGSDLVQLKEKVSEYDLGNIVSFLGMISEKEDLISLYHNSDILVLPTYHEGFPRVLYEAMMMNIGIITTFVGTINYLMKSEENCLELEVRNVESIVENVERLCANRGLLENISANGNRTIIEYLASKKLSHAEQVKKFVVDYES